jgi:hypothetical protein
MKLTSHAECTFTGWHDAPFAQRMHAHRWRVRLHYAPKDRVDGRQIRAGLQTALSRLVSQGLADTLGMDATNEGIVLWLAGQLKHLEPTKIEAWRDSEGLGATLEITP